MNRCLAALSAQDGASHRAGPEDYLRHGFGPTRLFQCVIAEEDGAVIGLAVFFPTFSTQRGRPGVYIQDLWLEPRARHRGLGRRLVAAVRAQAAGWGAEHMTLMVAGGNRTAKAFYEALGFRPLEPYAPLVLDGPAFDALETP
jgi:GNAT superfamily N-acetyltransferase